MNELALQFGYEYEVDPDLQRPFEFVELWCESEHQYDLIWDYSVVGLFYD